MSDRSVPASHTGAHDALAVGWALHTLDHDEATVFAAHLEECPHCRRTVDETLETLGDLAGAVVPADPPADLRRRLMDVVEAEAPAAPRVGSSGASSSGTPSSPHGSSSPGGAPGQRDAAVVPLAPRRRTRRWLAVAAVALVVAAVGGLVAANQSLRAERDSAQAAAAAQAERDATVADVLHEAGTPGVPHAVLASPQGTLVGLVVDDPAGPRVLTTGLDPNPSDHTYVLWGLDDGAPRALGTFDVAGQVPDVRSVPSAPEATPYAGFAVSLEPGRTAPASPTRVVASGQVGR